MDNQTIARRLNEFANTISRPEANLYRIRAYRFAADRVMTLVIPVEELIAREGRLGLETLTGIGTDLSYTIERLVQTGDFTKSPEKRPRRSERLDRVSSIRRRAASPPRCSTGCYE